MLQPVTLREPYSSENVAEIVREAVASGGTDALKERVTTMVRVQIGLPEGRIPERIGAWVHQLCLPHTAGTPEKVFIGKLASPIDLASLPGRKK